MERQVREATHLTLERAKTVHATKERGNAFHSRADLATRNLQDCRLSARDAK